MRAMSSASRAHAPNALHLYAQTHTGLVRPNNEDAHGLFPDARLALLADGLGGGRAGEVASTMAVQLIGGVLSRNDGGGTAAAGSDEATLLRREQTLRAAVASANVAIHAHAQADPGCAGMGATLVMAHWCGAHLLIGHAGDSRAYLLRTRALNRAGRVHRRQELHLLTRDHSTAQRDADQRQVYGGLSPAARTPLAHPRLTRALGVEPDVVLELHRHPAEPGDLVLLCSDGLTDMVDDTQIEFLINTCTAGAEPSPAHLPVAAQALMEAALQGGGRDNITVVLGLLAGSDTPEG